MIEFGKLMMIARLTQGRMGWLLLGFLLTISPLARGQQPELPAEVWIERLNHDSYATRQSAARMLREAGLEEWLPTEQPSDPKTLEDDSTSRKVIALLLEARTHRSQEVRLAASRILREIAHAAHESELQRLVNPNCEAAAIRLDHWHRFHELVGDDMAARHAFATVSRRLGTPLPHSGFDNRDASQSLPPWGQRLDPYRLAPDDTVGWMLLLLVDLEHQQTMPHLAARISIAMSHAPMGPSHSNSHEGKVLVRLIDRWIHRSGCLCSRRERLLIAMRYGCQQTARELSRQVLDEANAPAATVATALLVTSLLDPQQLISQAAQRLDDDRVAHVWQMIPSQKTRIRTEVRDVALALLLHHRGIDPRSVGFAQVQADPLLRFQDYTLGFADDASRADSRRLADQLIASHGGSSSRSVLPHDSR